MGWTDIFSKKNKKETTTDVVKKEPQQNSHMNALRNSYDLFLEGLDELKDFCVQNGVSYEETLTKFQIEVPKSFEDFAADFEIYSDSVLTNIPNAKAAIKRKVQDDARQTEAANKPVVEKSNYQPKHNENTEYLRTVKITSETETGKVADDFYDKVGKAYNDPRLANYTSSSLDEYEQLLNMMGEPSEEKGRRR